MRGQVGFEELPRRYETRDVRRCSVCVTLKKHTQRPPILRTLACKIHLVLVCSVVTCMSCQLLQYSRQVPSWVYHYVFACVAPAYLGTS